MCETLWEMLTVENINASATVVTALATVILMAITGFYAWQTRKLVQVEAGSCPTRC